MKQQPIGSYEWSMESQGNLNLKEKVTILKMLIKAQLKDKWSYWSYKMGLSKQQLSMSDLDEVTIPDSQIVQEALSIARETCSPVLLNHCFRTYFFAQLLRQVDGLPQVDDELLFVGSILHDLGLTEDHNKNLCHCCFTIEGAKFSESLALEHHWSPQRTRQLFTVISAHLNPEIDKEVYGTESYLLGGGAVMDVLGSRYHTIPNTLLHKVHTHYPREGFKEEIIETMNYPHVSDSRAGFLKKAGFATFASKNPLDNLIQ
ncbi:hypothetical protein AAG747_02970 [Rapidithrix thailandica]|uniref:HD domain-containing protein n=1 Tax=Rapidithrix thailandica TaxID=413964 RepID=A0AAW9S367_9BACT